MNKKGFTFLELIVGIGIIILLGIGINNINFNKTNDFKKIEDFGNKIIFEIEKIRNDSLIGKGITESSALITPDLWEIEIIKGSGAINDSGSINTFYKIGETKSDVKEMLFDNFEIINSIYCKNENSSTVNQDTGTGKIIFEKGKYKIGGCVNSNLFNELVINIGYKGLESKITFNAMNGLIKRD